MSDRTIIARTIPLGWEGLYAPTMNADAGAMSGHEAPPTTNPLLIS